MKNKIIKILTKTNDHNYNITKAIEELSELQTVLLQYINKPNKVDKQEIIDEIGDVKIRIRVLTNIFGKDKVKKRELFKLTKFKTYIKKGQYEGKI